MNLLVELATRLNLTKVIQSENGEYQTVLDTGARVLTTPRNAKIIAHYQREFDRKHLGHNDALDRCLGDMAGRNYKPDLEQRTEVRL